MKRVWILLLAAMLLMSAPVAQGEGGEAQLTIMVYMTGSDLESGGGAATRDITEMLRSGVDGERVNVLLMTGGSRKWWGGFPNDQVCIYRAAGARPELMYQTDMVSMGEAGTLEQLLNYGYENCPAEQYALILWDHGGGPLEGVCYDELFRSDRLSMQELSGALRASPFNGENKLEWIGFDACLMATVETAYACAPHAKYMIASQETEPGTGWSYSFLKGLEEGVDGAEVGRRIVDGYFAGAEEGSAERLTLSCVDLGKIGGIEEAMDGMFEELDAIISPESFSMLSNSRRDAKNFGRATTGSDYDLVDLYHLAEQYLLIAPEGSDALMAAVEEAVVYQRSGLENSCGLSVYYPYYNKERYKSVWGEAYASLGFSAGYTKYMEDYADLWLGETMADWTGLRTVGLPPEDGAQELTMELTQDQAAHFASAELYILDELGAYDAYYDIYHVDDVRLENNVLHADYGYQALYALDAQGRPLTNALTYITRDDTYFVRVVLSNVSAEEDFFAWVNDELKMVYLQCKRDADTDELRVVGVIEIPGAKALQYLSDDDVLLSGKQVVTLDPDDWAWIQFMRQPRVRADAQDGTVAAYTQWSYSTEIVGLTEYYSIDNSKPWTLKFCEEQFGARNLSAQYVVRDTQGEAFASNLLPIENPNLVEDLEEEIVLVDEADLKVTLTSVAVADASLDAGLYLRMRVDNRSSKPISLQPKGITFDETTLMCMAQNDKEVKPGAAEILFKIPAADFPPMAKDSMRALSFNLYVTRDRDYRNAEKYPVRIEREIALGSLRKPLKEAGAPLAEAGAPLAEARVGDVRYALLSLQEQEDGALHAQIHVVNEGSESVDLDLNGDSIINGCFFSGNCRGDRLVLPAGCDSYVRVKIDSSSSSPENMLLESKFDEVNGFDRWGINAVETLTLCTISLWNEQKIDFAFDEPFALSGEHPAPAEAVLWAEEGASLSVRGAEIAQDTLRLELAIRNGTDSEIEVCPEEIRVDGRASEARIFTEQDSMFSATSVKASPRFTQRGIIEIPLEGSDAPKRLELLFRYRGDDDIWQHCSVASVEPLQGGAEALTVVRGEKLENPVIDPLSLLNPEVEMPEDAQRRAVTLAAQLTAEQAERFEYGVIMLAEPVEDGSYRIYLVQQGVAPDANGLLTAEYRGLLPCISGQDAPIPCVMSADGTGATLYFVRLGAESIDQPQANFDAIHLRFDDDGRARVESAEISREVRALERFDSVVFNFWDLVPTYNADGSMAYAQFWETSDFVSGKSYSCDHVPVSFAWRPVDASKLCVLVSVHNDDGTGYTLKPIPYNEAILQGE